MRARLLLHCCGTVLAGVVEAHSAVASPTFAVSSDGTCPTQEAVVAALHARGFSGATRAEVRTFTLAVHSQPAGASLCLRAQAESCLLERSFASQDCEALAEAIAVVVEGYFVQVERGDGQHNWVTQDAEHSRTPLASDSTDDAAGGVARGGELGRVEQTPARDAPTGATPPISPIAKKELAKAAFSTNTASAAAPDPSTIHGYSLLAGIGTTVTLPELAASPVAELGGGIGFKRVPLVFDLLLSTSASQESGKPPDRVTRWPSQGLIRIGVPWGHTLGLLPWLGIGLSIARLREPDLPVPKTKTTSSLLVGTGVELRWVVTNALFGRAGLGCALLATRDRYRVQPDGEIGVGPRTTCSATIGLGADFSGL